MQTKKKLLLKKTLMMNRAYPKSNRRKSSECCKNCEHITVNICLPNYDYDDEKPDASTVMRDTAKATNISHQSDFLCTFTPEWKPLLNELTHYCGQFAFRENWKAGYQDIERTWEEVDRVYATRWDCIGVPEGVRHAA
jgi:hypothetical protein